MEDMSHISSESDRVDSDLSDSARDQESPPLPSYSTMGNKSMNALGVKTFFRTPNPSMKTKVMLVSGQLSQAEAATLELPVKSWRNAKNNFCLLRLGKQVRDPTISKMTGWAYFYPFKGHLKWEDMGLKLPKAFELEEEEFAATRDEVIVQELPRALKKEGPRNIAPKLVGDDIGVAILKELSSGKSLDELFLFWWKEGRFYDANYLLLNRQLYEHAELLFGVNNLK